MIGNPKWFEIRKYGGWGVFPKTYQGWLYILAFILPILLVQSNQSLSLELKNNITLVIVLFILIDVADIMLKIKRDERETAHEAMAERNASWFMVIVLALGLMYQSIISGANGILAVDPILILALFAGVLAKALTYFFLRNK